MNLTQKNLELLLAQANWQAMGNPEMEFRVVHREGQIEVNEYPEHSHDFREGEQVLYTACHWPGFEGNRSKAQAAFKRQIPEIVGEIIAQIPDLPLEPKIQHGAEAKSKLQAARISAGMTQQQLAKKSGVKLGTIQKYERLYRDINRAAAQTIDSLAKALRCKAKDILN